MVEQVSFFDILLDSVPIKVTFMKLLLSWLAYVNDFKQTDTGQEVSQFGPTYQFHQHFFKGYDRHDLLSGDEDPDPRLDYLVNRLRLDFPEHNTQGVYLPIQDPINLREILTRLETYLLSLEAEAIDIFISPGTPAMQTAWYFLHMNLGLPTRLIQTRAPGLRGVTQAEMIVIDIERNPFPATAILSQKSQAPLSKALKSHFLQTPSIQPTYENARKVAATDDVTVLIHGNTGTGKEHLARFIHDQSVRSGSGEFVAVNCSAMRDDLLESRLFGYRKGAFTGADTNMKGMFEEARGGTLFLDEIGDISPYMQQALLRVLQDKTITRVGETVSRSVDVRVVAATHRDLLAMCEEGTFRWDLYYRLAIVELELPDLIMRGPAEIKQLIQYFLEQQMKVLRKQHLLTFSPEAKAALMAHSWPGNIRELMNVIRRLYVMVEGRVELTDLPERIRHQRESQSLHWKAVEAAHIRKVYQLKQGNQRQTLLALGYGSSNTLRKKMEEYGIDM